MAMTQRPLIERLALLEAALSIGLDAEDEGYILDGILGEQPLISSAVKAEMQYIANRMIEEAGGMEVYEEAEEVLRGCAGHE